MKAILIDTVKRDIREVEYNNVSDLHKMLGGYFEIAKIWSNGDVLFVDEEGKLKGKKQGFLLPDRRDVYAGNGVVVGREMPDTAETLFPLTTVAMLRDMIEWIYLK